MTPSGSDVVAHTTVRWDDKRFQVSVERATRRSLSDAGRIWKAYAKAMCPVGDEIRGPYERGPHAGQPWTARFPGTLKKSIRYRITGGPRRRKPYGLQIIAGDYMAYYAAWVHWGTSKHPGQPFLLWARDAAKSAITAAFEGALTREEVKGFVRSARSAALW
jgi:hypothetical protein